MLRAVILSVALFIGLGALIPLATDYAEAGQQKQRKSKKRSSAKYKKYSKAWWKAYRASKKKWFIACQTQRSIALETASSGKRKTGRNCAKRRKMGQDHDLER